MQDREHERAKKDMSTVNCLVGHDVAAGKRVAIQQQLKCGGNLLGPKRSGCSNLEVNLMDADEKNCHELFDYSTFTRTAIQKGARC